MNSLLSRSWRANRLAFISVGISSLEIVVIWGALLISIPWRQLHEPMLLKITAGAWLLGGLGSVALGIVALIVYGDRAPGAAAVSFGVVAFLFCGLTMIA